MLAEARQPQLDRKSVEETRREFEAALEQPLLEHWREAIRRA